MKGLNASFWAPFFIVSIGVTWSVVYVISVQSSEDFEPVATLFIEPLLYITLATSTFVLWHLRNAWRSKHPDLDDMDDEIGMMEPRRLALVFSLPIYGTAIYFLGFAIPTLIYSFTLCIALGARRLIIVSGITIGIQLTVWLGFVELLGVPIPLLP